jgi:hypothetical protein
MDSRGNDNVDWWAVSVKQRREIKRLQDAKRRALALADERGIEADRLRVALQTIADNCDPDDPPWTIPENGRQFVGRTAIAALTCLSQEIADEISSVR